jgi:hypothetical protein
VTKGILLVKKIQPDFTHASIAGLYTVPKICCDTASKQYNFDKEIGKIQQLMEISLLADGNVNQRRLAFHKFLEQCTYLLCRDYCHHCYHKIITIMLAQPLDHNSNYYCCM